MNQRDNAILKSLESFRVLDRDQIIALHFKGVKDEVSSCNKVLKRLQRDNYIECDINVRPFNYFPKPTNIKKDSAKIRHFKLIADFIIEIQKYAPLTEYSIEVKLGKKGTVEPDVYMVWNNTPYFVEVQRTFYGSKFMAKKMERYKDYYKSGEWKERTPHFPFVWIITDHMYDLDTTPLRVYQTKTVEDFINLHRKKKESK